ncbi:GNAT family N-acetyltransferase [Alkalicoccus halolimnae]|uniref:GNAT family N-acetyltransferase n=1 Tax=Alkalicoccus halolimnae TaxID=1667239 RepID=A0AAJ8N3U7_9BACI|nr:GNAT family N-acetyltransferase [Alkalicoccus halolimnae]
MLAAGGNALRNRHLASIVIGLHRDYRSKGTGSKLFTVLDSRAKNQEIQRLELTMAV